MNGLRMISRGLLMFALLGLFACAAQGGNRSTGQVVDDTAIAGKIKTALVADKTTDAIDIDVEVDKARVQLNGFVDSTAARDRAGEIARTTDGVIAVTNNLQIAAKGRMAGEYIDDKTLTVRVKAALADDPVAHALKIDVEVNRGIVSLGGHVDSAAESAAAMNAAARAEGVVRVINNLEVRNA